MKYSLRHVFPAYEHRSGPHPCHPSSAEARQGRLVCPHRHWPSDARQRYEGGDFGILAWYALPGGLRANVVSPGFAGMVTNYVHAHRTIMADPLRSHSTSLTMTGRPSCGLRITTRTSRMHGLQTTFGKTMGWTFRRHSCKTSCHTSVRSASVA